MPEDCASIPGATPSHYQRTTGGNLQWKPPSIECLQQMLSGYEVIDMLGHGGMGAVYKARQKSLDRLVAIKILPPEAAGDEDANFVERFRNEARTMARMNHPAIVSVYDFGETSEGQLYIVMEFVDGTDVSKMILSQGRLPPEHALAITAHVCDALQYAHTHGVIHRDIKPANVLINMEGAVKVADFGLAKASDAGQGGLTKTNMAMGTPDFVAPEALITGMNVDGRADLYAVGVMLYNMLTGNVPRGMFRMPSTTVSTDPRFDQIITKSMEMDREMRYQTAFDIRKDLDVILTMPHVEAGGQSSAAIPKQQIAQKPVSRGPQQPLNKSARVPVRSSQPPPQVTDDENIASGTDAQQRKKTNLGPIIGMAATVVVAAGLFFVFKPKPPTSAAPKTPVVTAPEPVKPEPVTLAPDAPKSEPVTTVQPPATTAPERTAAKPPAIPQPPPAAPAIVAVPPAMPAAPTPPPPATASLPAVPAAPAMPPAAPVNLKSQIADLKSSDPRLVQLATGFKARHDADAQKPFVTALAALNQSYVGNGIGRARTAAQKKGALDEVTALDAEKARVQNNQPLPPADLESFPESLKTLRATYRTALAKIEADRDRKAAPLYDIYLGALDAYVVELTKANKVDEAQKVKTLRDEIAAQKPQVDAGAATVQTGGAARTGTNRPGTKSAPTSGEDSPSGGRGSRWYEAARWVVSVGGFMNVNKNGQQVRIEKEADIPPGKFEVLDVNIDGNPRSAGVTNDDFTRLSGFKELRSFRVAGLNAGDAAFAFFPSTPALTSIILAGLPVTDAVLAHIAPLRQLTELQVQSAPGFTGKDLEKLASLPVLKSVWFVTTGFSDAGAKALSGAMNLEFVRLDNAPSITDEGIAALGSLMKLSQLHVLRCPKVRGTTLASWESAVALTTLAFANCPIGEDAVRAISRFISLTELHLDYAPGLTDETLPLLAPLTKLNYFSAMECRISGTSFAALRGWTQLRKLALHYGTPITAEGLAVIVATFPNLEDLTLGGGAQLKAEDYRCLTGLKNLRYFGAPLPTLDDAGLAEISRIISLDDLYLAESAITARGLTALKSLKSLNRLTVVNCKNIDDSAIPALKDLKLLKSLEIKGTAITEDGAAALKKALPGCTVNR